MRTKTAVKLDSKTNYAVQNAKLGLINVADLSLLTGIEAARLNSFAKQGIVNHYGEYHGKRFFNFQEIVNWANGPDDQSEAKPLIRNGINEKLQDENCPYEFEKTTKGPHGTEHLQVVWKEVSEE